MNIKGAYTSNAQYVQQGIHQIPEWFEEENTHKQAWEEEN